MARECGTLWSRDGYGTGPCNVESADVCPYNERYEDPDRCTNGGKGQTEDKEKCPFIDDDGAAKTHDGCSLDHGIHDTIPIRL